MQLNNIPLISYADNGTTTTFIVDATLEEALALNGETLEIYAGSTLYKSYLGYTVISVGEQGEYTELRAARKLDPDTAAELERIDANTNAAQQAQAQTQTQVDENAAAIVELAALIAGEE